MVEKEKSDEIKAEDDGNEEVKIIDLNQMKNLLK